MIEFGTGGWRAIIADGFTKQNVRRVAQAMVLIRDQSDDTPMVVGYDRRFLSREAAWWAAEVFAGNGVRVHLYNGIKVFTSGGRDADVATTELVQTQANQVEPGDIRDMRGADAVAQGLIHSTKSFNDYIDAVLSAIDVPAIRDAGLRVVLDPMFGVAQTCLQTVLVDTTPCLGGDCHRRT